MKNDSPNASLLSWTGLALFIATLAYAGIYALAVDECPVISSGGNVRPRLEVQVRYHVGWRPIAGMFRGHEAFWLALFAPIHAVDRALRPTVWYAEIS